MRSLKLTLFLSALLALGLVGCSRDSGPLSPAADGDDAPGLLFGWQLPEEATLTSATLKLYAVDSSYSTVNVHRLTRDWVEATVTWDNFAVNDGGAYDPTVLASFTANFGPGYASMDVTSQVIAWMNGEDPNFGFLLRQPLLDSPRTEMLSRERDTNRPVLELVYSQNGETTTAVIEPLGDAQINAAEPTTAFGLVDKLYAGWRDAGEKVSLVRFDLDVLPPDDGGDDGDDDGDAEGCTRTIGFWKRHSGCGHGNQADLVTPLLGDGIWLGTAGGAKSLGVADARVAFRVLGQHTFGHPHNGITKLYAQLLAAKLNIANGADGAAVAQTIAEADAFLAGKAWPAWRHLTQRPEGQGTELEGPPGRLQRRPHRPGPLRLQLDDHHPPPRARRRLPAGFPLTTTNSSSGWRPSCPERVVLASGGRLRYFLPYCPAWCRMASASRGGRKLDDLTSCALP